MVTTATLPSLLAVVLRTTGRASVTAVPDMRRRAHRAAAARAVVVRTLAVAVQSELRT
jgi:hypothetical protein